MTKLSIVITCRNMKRVLLDCLESIRRNPPACPYEVIVVDDASSDGSAAEVSRLFPDAILIQNERNLGFSGANNRGLCRAGGEYLLLLNSDTLLKPGAFDAMVACLDQNPSAGMTECQLLNADGSPQLTYNDMPNHLRLFLQCIGIRRVIPRRVLTMLADWLPMTILPKTIRYYLRYHKKTYRADATPFILPPHVYLSGACLMVRRTCLDSIGLLDENYFMYSEDSDLCLRAHVAGWKLHFIPRAEVVHIVGAGTGPNYRETRIEAHRSTLYFFYKHRGFLSFFASKLLVMLSILRIMFTGLFQRWPELSWKKGTQILVEIARIWSFPKPCEPPLRPAGSMPAASAAKRQLDLEPGVAKSPGRGC